MDVIECWHDYVARNEPALLDALIADDAVFLSPVVHRPQVGKALVVKYLTAALAVLNTADFRYLEQWRGPCSAVLEFAVTIDGIAIEGIDMIHWNEAGLITRFKVMMRPMKALSTVIPLMAAELQAHAA